MPNKESAELTEPSVGTLDDPVSFVASEFPAVFVLSLLVVFSVQDDEVDASPFSVVLAADRSHRYGRRSPVSASVAAGLWGEGL
jgi:hypothetical protein